jgi:acetyltransferase EpsM
MIQGDGGHASVVKDLLTAKGELLPEGLAVVAVGKNEDRKKEVTRLAVSFNFSPPLIHPRAVVAESAVIGEGTVVMAGAVIQAHATIGRHVIVNTGATVDHHSVVEDFAHIGPGVHLCGTVHVGEGALMGVGSCAVPGARVSAWSLVKAGTVAK